MTKDWTIFDTDMETGEKAKKLEYANKVRRLFHPIILGPLICSAMFGFLMFKRHYESNRKIDDAAHLSS